MYAVISLLSHPTHPYLSSAPSYHTTANTLHSLTIPSHGRLLPPYIGTPFFTSTPYGAGCTTWNRS